MADGVEFIVDEIIITEPRLISDKRMSDLIRSNITSGVSPNPAKYLPCEVVFEPKQNSNIKEMLDKVKLFVYDKDESKEATEPIYGPFYVQPDGHLYIGQFDGDIRSGRGIQVFRNGCYYEGYFKNDQTNKKGRLIFEDGDMYIGELQNNCMEGYGTYFKVEGSKYTGYFKSDQPEGKGKEEWEDGATFEGTYLQGAKNGFGVFKFKTGDVYSGNFKDDIFHGEGTLTRNNKHTFKGNWEKGDLLSPATIIYPDKKIYTGELKKMKPFGEGELKDKDILVKGNFVNGSCEGEALEVDLNKKTERRATYKEGRRITYIDDKEKASTYAQKYVVKQQDISKNENNAAQSSHPPQKKKGFLCCG